MSNRNELIIDMSNACCSFDSVIYLPTLTLTRYCPSLNDVLRNIVENKPNLEHLKKQWSDFVYIGNMMAEKKPDFFEIYEALANNTVGFEFLVTVHIQTPYNYKFTDDWEFMSCDYGSCAEIHYVLAKDMNDACKQTIELAEQRFKFYEDLSKKTQQQLANK